MKLATGEYGTNGNHCAPEFKEKTLKSKPFVKYPFAFYNKYGPYVKPCTTNFAYVRKTLPTFS